MAKLINDGQADLDDLIGRDPVVVAHRAGVAAEEGVKVLLPLPERRRAVGDDHLAVEEIDRALRVE